MRVAIVTALAVAELVVPAALAATPFTLRTPPVGAVLSTVNVRAVLLTLPTTSLPSSFAGGPGAPGLAVHE